MNSSPEMEQKLLDAVKKGLIVTRTENNPTLKCSYKGSGNLVTPKWNVKIYHSGSVVCTDKILLQEILDNKIKPPDSSLKVVRIDDSGWGFPLLGVMIGINIVGDSKIWTDTVPVKYFQDPLWESKDYLNEYASLGMKILDNLNVRPETHRIEICTGNINKNLKNLLRKYAFDVRVVEIKGLLQDQLEHLFCEYVKVITGKDLAYDPKIVSGKLLGTYYYSVLNWGKANSPHLLKSGWKAIQKELHNA
jgi:hypothetical protein